MACTSRPDPCTALGNDPAGCSSPLLYVDESGCPTCSRAFAQLCEGYLDTPGVRIVVRASGMQLDISKYLAAAPGRVIWDKNGALAACLGLNSSAAVFFDRNGSVDTTLLINSGTLEAAFPLIRSRLAALPVPAGP